MIMSLLRSALMVMLMVRVSVLSWPTQVGHQCSHAAPA